MHLIRPFPCGEEHLTFQPLCLLIGQQQELLIGRGVNIERNAPLFQSIFHQLGHIDGMSAKQKIEVVGK